MTRKHLFGLLSIAALAACGGADTTASGTTQPLARASSVTAPNAKEEEYHFNGYRLKVQLGDDGKPTSAKADKDGKEVPTFIVPAREVTVCVPKSTNGSAGPQCEPLLYMPEKTFFKIGTGTLCPMWLQGHVIYYPC
jgi:hypothetical protein